MTTDPDHTSHDFDLHLTFELETGVKIDFGFEFLLLQTTCDGAVAWWHDLTLGGVYRVYR